MQHDLDWYIRKIREGNPEAEAAFRKDYFYPFSEIIRHHTFAAGHIPDLMGFTQMAMDRFVRHIKCENPVKERVTQKDIEKFITNMTGEFIGNEQLRPLFRAIHDQDEEAEDQLRSKFMHTIFLLFDKELYNPDKHDCVPLANRIMDEWIRIAKRDGEDCIRNFVAFLTHNMNLRITDELKREYRNKERCQKKGGLIDEWLPKTAYSHKTEILKGLIEKILMSGCEHEEEGRREGEWQPSSFPKDTEARREKRPAQTNITKIWRGYMRKNLTSLRSNTPVRWITIGCWNCSRHHSASSRTRSGSYSTNAFMKTKNSMRLLKILHLTMEERPVEDPAAKIPPPPAKK